MSRNYLITGGAGFIGSNFVRHVLHSDNGARVTNLDLLTYAGVAASLADFEDEPRYRFVRGDIGDAPLVNQIIVWTRHDCELRSGEPCRSVYYRPCALLADERRRYLRAARGGVSTRGPHVCSGFNGRGVRLARSRSSGGELDTGPLLSIRSLQSRRRPAGRLILNNIRISGDHHAVHQQLRAVPVPGKGDTAVRHQPATTILRSPSTATAYTSATGFTSRTTAGP